MIWLNITRFGTIAFLLLAWRIAPYAGSDWQHWMISALVAAAAAEGLIRNSIQARALRGPGPRVNVPLWLIAWLVIGALVWTYGTPHLRIIYGPGRCSFAGWNGYQIVSSYNCDLIELLPLPVKTEWEKSRKVQS